MGVPIEKFLNNFNSLPRYNYPKNKDTWKNWKIYEPRYLVNNAFMWTDTPENHNYWQQVHSAYIAWLEKDDVRYEQDKNHFKLMYANENESVRWYHKGKLEKDESEPEIDNSGLKVGDIVVLNQNFYHKTRGVMSNSLLVIGNYVNVLTYKLHPLEITKIEINKDGVEMMKLKNKGPWFVCSEWKLYKTNENINSDIDPYNEENWGQTGPSNLYVIYVLGQDMNFLSAKKEKIIDNRRGWKDYYYTIATKNKGEIHFDGPNFESHPYPAEKVNDILNGKELVGYLSGPFGNTTQFDTLQNLCNMMEIPIECIKMYKN